MELGARPTRVGEEGNELDTLALLRVVGALEDILIQLSGAQGR